jgi:hypothetical protein
MKEVLQQISSDQRLIDYKLRRWNLKTRFISFEEGFRQLLRYSPIVRKNIYIIYPIE